MNLVQVLKEARELISSPDRWTTAICARNPDGYMVSTHGPEGERFCSVGAIQHVMWRHGAAHDFGLYYDVCKLLAVGWGVETIEGLEDKGHTVCWRENDRHDHTQVLEAFDVAILRAELDASSVLEPTPERELVTA